MSVVVGQRWVSHTEPNLGLGIITHVEGRRLEISFPAADEQRHYAIDQAPISRIAYQEGDLVSDMEDIQYRVNSVDEKQGLLVYQCEDELGKTRPLSELLLNCFVQFSSPEKRLFSGQIDDMSSFKLRYDTMDHLYRLQQSPVAGLLGARVDLLPHQLYIANEVSKRHAPRVLLADEVGLGKTIEAGLILHQQIHTGQVQRVLVLVPDSLIYQWLVEMLRRFNLSFSLFDQTRIHAIQNLDEGDGFDSEEENEVLLENPFETEQLIICGFDSLMKNPKSQKMILDCDWDTVVVDEAHHLHWQNVDDNAADVVEVTEKGDDYRFVEALSHKSEGLLLLTATPEQAGVDSHFARLRLLDPDRFHSLQSFKDEVAQYKPLSELLGMILQWETNNHTIDDLSDQQKQWLADNNELERLDEAESREKIIRDLLDRHGTGRVLFRNTRNAHDDFPKRILHPYPMPCPEIYTPDDDDAMNCGEMGLTPEHELAAEVWLKRDPRIEWLLEKVEELSNEKVLIISHHATTAIQLQNYFSKRHGIKSTCFHEGLSLIERDRAAAYFAERDGGAQCLFCSEIGSEGRNFQFAQHLVLFDLPRNPDLIEQRIGRLDRIGQSSDIHIHVPYLTGSSQEVVFELCDKGLGVFEQSVSFGYALFEQLEADISHHLKHPELSLDGLIEKTQTHAAKMLNDIQEGRDRLQELNSCREPMASQLVDWVEEEEQANRLADYFENVLEEFGVEQEDHSALSWVLRPTDQMKNDYFPGLKEDGNTVTLDRMKALSRDDIEFLSWEHPMVAEAMEMILRSDTGNTAVALITVKGLKPGTLLLESIYSLQTISPKALQLHRYLPLKPIRFLIDAKGKNLSQVVNHNALNDLCQPLKRKVARQVIEQMKAPIEAILQHSETLANQQGDQLIQEAVESMKASLSEEINRLIHLQKVNPSIRQSEIDYLEQKRIDCEQHILKASMQMQAIRLVIAS